MRCACTLRAPALPPSRLCLGGHPAEPCSGQHRPWTLSGNIPIGGVRRARNWLPCERRLCTLGYKNLLMADSESCKHRNRLPSEAVICQYCIKHDLCLLPPHAVQLHQLGASSGWCCCHHGTTTLSGECAVLPGTQPQAGDNEIKASADGMT